MPDPFADIPAAASAVADPFADIPAAADPFGDVPDSSATIAGRIDSDVSYIPSRDEFRSYREFNAGKKTKLSDAPGIAGRAAAQLAGKLWDAVKATPDAVLTRTPINSTVQSLLEAGSRGTFDLGRSARPLIDNIASHFTDDSREDFARKFMAGTLKIAPGEVRLPPGAALSPKARPVVRGRDEFDNYDRALLKRLDSAYDDYKLDRDFERFQVNRALDQVRADAAAGKGNLAPIEVGEPSQPFAEGAAPFLDASTVATMGAGAIAQQGLKAAGREVMTTGLDAAARAGGAVGRLATTAGALPENITRKVVGAVASPETAEAAAKAVERGSLAVGAGEVTGVIPAELPLPGARRVAEAAMIAKGVGATATGAGEAAAAAARAVGPGPSRYGIFDRLAFDAKAPAWLQRAANALRPLDAPAAAAAGVAGAPLRGAAGGAGTGAALGYTLSGGDPEAAIAGAGGGGLAGAGGGLVGFALSGKRRDAAARTADLARWLADKSSDQVSRITSLALDEATALKLADTERLVRGLFSPETGGDVDFHYLKPDEFKQRTGGIAKGAQVLDDGSGRVQVLVNTGFGDASALFHEALGHAVARFDEFSPQRQALYRNLFGLAGPDGAVLQPGRFSPKDMAEFTQQYRDRLPTAARAEWDALAPEARAGRMQEEVTGELFRSWLSGAPSDTLPKLNSVPRKLLDALHGSDLVNYSDRLRGALQQLGVRFDGHGVPSDIFFRDGAAVTSNPQINAALREYVRARSRTNRRLAANDEEPAAVYTAHDFNGPNGRALAETFKDADIFSRDAAGAVRMLGGTPVLLTAGEQQRIANARSTKLVEWLGGVPTQGEVGAMTKQGNDTFAGRFFTDDQMKAIHAMPETDLPGIIKARLQALNNIVQLQDGTPIVIDYNAATDTGKRYLSLAMTTRKFVPIEMRVSKAGNFFLTTLDLHHFSQKLNQWQKTKPRAFDLWARDRDAFLVDVQKYLQNHAGGRQGSVGLDADGARAIEKKNVINDFFNVPGHGEVNPVALSSKSSKDNLIRSRRIDRIQTISESTGDKWPVDYWKMKQNLLPGPATPKAKASPEALIRHHTATARANLQDAFAALAPEVRNEFTALAESSLNDAIGRGNPVARAQRLDQLTAAWTESDAGAFQEAIVRGGLNGGRTWLKQRASAAR